MADGACTVAGLENCCTDCVSCKGKGEGCDELHDGRFYRVVLENSLCTMTDE
jgi:hypothetical protein